MDIQHHDGTESLLLFALNLLLYTGMSIIGNLAFMDTLASIAMHVVGTLSLAVTAYYAIKNGRKKRK